MCVCVGGGGALVLSKPLELTPDLPNAVCLPRTLDGLI